MKTKENGKPQPTIEQLRQEKVQKARAEIEATCQKYGVQILPMTVIFNGRITTTLELHSVS